jgi:hypothetical protein
VNELKLTYEGIDACGERLAALVLDTAAAMEVDAQNPRRVTHLSLIGYSMGGLMARYAVGRLFAGGWLSPPGQADDDGTTSTAERRSAADQPLQGASGCGGGGGGGGDAAASAGDGRSAGADATAQGGGARGGEDGGPAAAASTAPQHYHTWKGRMQPVWFVTIATPHLGCWT